MNKKGIIEIQFNWIFILAIGAIILLFFSVIILRQKNISEVATSDIILKNLDAIFSGAEVSLGTVNLIDIPEVEIEFSCNSYRIGKVSRQIQLMGIFTPISITSSRLITWTLDWSVPYRVTNLLYLTSPKIRFIFIGENGCIINEDCFAKNIFNSTPEEIQKELIEFNQVPNIKYEGDDHTRLIFFNKIPTLPEGLKNLKKGTVTALNIVDGGNKGEKGTIEFYEPDENEFGNKKVSQYIRKPTLLGAIFAGNPEIYNCVMENSFKKLNIVTKVYRQKTSDLRAFYISQSDSCKDYHIVTELDKIEQQSSTFSLSSVYEIDLAAKRLEIQNKDAQLLSCALIY